MDEERCIDLVITGGTVLTMAPAAEPLADGAVAVCRGEIVAVGPAGEVRAAAGSARVIDARGGLILPGFVNTHTHLAMTMLRGLADDLPLVEWLENHIWPAERAMVTADSVVVGSRLAAGESIRAGVTCVADMYFFAERVIGVLQEVGLRGVVGESMIDFPTASAATPQAALERQRWVLEQFRGNSLVQPAIAPHSPYTVSPANLAAEAELAEEFGVLLMIHLAETRWELEKIKSERGSTPVAYLADLGVLSDRTVAAHCVHVSEEDLDRLLEFGVGVASNPVSNLKLASGIAPLPEMIRRGLKVSFGTDGAASNNTLDLLRDAQIAALVYKGVSGDPTVASARTIAEVLTRGGAEVLGLADQIGTLEVGKRADVICISLEGLHAHPVFDPFSHLMYAARSADVIHVVIDGRVVMADRELLTVDEACLKADIDQLVAGLR